MTQYFTDFSEYSVSDDVRNADWSEPWSAFDIVDIIDVNGENRLYLEVADTNVDRVLVWDAVEDSADTEILALVEFKEHPMGVTKTTFRGAHRIDSINEDGWVIGPDGQSSEYLITYINGGSGTTVGSESHSLTGDTLYWIRVQSTTDTHRIRVWADGSSEPGTWDLDVTDSNIPASGASGIYIHEFLSATQVAQFGVGTNGDSAPSVGVQAPTGLTVSQDGSDLLVDWTSSEGEFIVQRERYVGSGEPS